MTELLTPEDIRGLLNISIPPTPARAKYQIDAVGVLRAQRFLAIDHAIWFRWTTNQRAYANHRWLYESKVLISKINVGQDWPIDIANKAIWHELGHAAQLENYIRAGKSAYDFESDYDDFGKHGERYWDNPFERDAEQIAQENMHKCLLIAK